MRLQLLPAGDRQVLSAAHFTSHEIHIDVQVPVIHLFDHMLPDQLAEFFHVKNKPGPGIRYSFYGNKQLVIMAMPVLIGTFTKNLFVLLVIPVGVKKPVGCVKMLKSC